MELDVNQILNTVVAGGAIYAGIRVEIKFIWKFYESLNKRVEKLESDS
jgi:hypothetical protein